MHGPVLRGSLWLQGDPQQLEKHRCRRTAVVMFCGPRDEGALRDRWGCFGTGEDETTGGIWEHRLSQGPAGLGRGGKRGRRRTRAQSLDPQGTGRSPKGMGRLQLRPWLARSPGTSQKKAGKLTPWLPACLLLLCGCQTPLLTHPVWHSCHPQSWGR